MKKAALIFLTVALAFSVAACGKKPAPQPPPPPPVAPEAPPPAPPPAVITIPPMAPSPPPREAEAERIETADFEEQEETLDEEFELPPPPPLDRVVESARTLVSDPDAAEELRRKISRFEPELSFDTLDEDSQTEEEDIEEISLEPEDEISPEPPALAASLLASTPPGVAARTGSAALALPPTVIPVSVDVVGGSGQTDISIPVEVVLNQGRAQVQINLRLTLNLKLTP